MQRRVIIVGAGLTGLVAAKSYLEMNPTIDLTVVDKDGGVGGVWSSSRIYDGLIADLPAPAYELSDLQMMDEFSIPKSTDITGGMFKEYLVRYSKKFDLLKRCQFNTEVLKVERDGMGWRLNTVHNSTPFIMTCDLLIMATGVCSTPYTPNTDT